MKAAPKNLHRLRYVFTSTINIIVAEGEYPSCGRIGLRRTVVGFALLVVLGLGCQTEPDWAKIFARQAHLATKPNLRLSIIRQSHGMQVEKVIIESAKAEENALRHWHVGPNDKIYILGEGEDAAWGIQDVEINVSITICDSIGDQEKCAAFTRSRFESSNGKLVSKLAVQQELSLASEDNSGSGQVRFQVTAKATNYAAKHSVTPVFTVLPLAPD